MATPVPRVSDNPVVQEHYAAQLGVTAALAQVSDTLSNSPSPTEALAALTREFQAAAVSVAIDYYTELRDQAGVTGAFRPPVIEPWSQEQLTTYLDAATSEIDAEAERLLEQIANAQRLTINAGTDEIFTSIESDPRRPRWARVARPGACSLCMLAAIRGAVYRTETTASFRPHMRIEGRGGNCQCDVEVSWTKYEAPAHIRAVEQLYVESTDGIRGSKEKQNAFRRALAAEQASR